MATATVRVRATSESAGARPDQASMERAAELLKEGGFEVLRIGRFGVNIRGDDHVFRRELGINVARGGSLVEAPRPSDKELSQLIDLVEITGPPTNFG